MRSDINTIILTMITTGVGLFTLYFPENRSETLILSTITLVGYLLFIYISKIEQLEKEILELKKVLKRTDDLIEIRADIKNLKRGLKNE